jgi:spore coat protein B
MTDEGDRRMESMINRQVLINRGEPESRLGYLLAIKDDHLVLQNDEEGIIYYKTGHIKSISLQKDQLIEPMIEESKMESPWLDVNHFDEILENMRLSKVQINRGGPESVHGVLLDYTDGLLTLLANHQIINIFTDHLKNISFSHSASEGEQDDDDLTNNLEDKKENAQSTNKDNNGNISKSTNDSSSSEEEKKQADATEQADTWRKDNNKTNRADKKDQVTKMSNSVVTENFFERSYRIDFSSAQLQKNSLLTLWLIPEVDIRRKRKSSQQKKERKERRKKIV